MPGNGVEQVRLQNRGEGGLSYQKIYIKGVFTEWQEVTPVQAFNYMQLIKPRFTAMNEEEKNKHVNKNRLKGITVEELEERFK